MAASVSEQFRERLEAENSLIAQRVSWLILSQSFLFIAYTAALVARPPGAHEPEINRLLHIFPVLGLVIVAGVYAAIWAALLSIQALRQRFAAIEPNSPNPFDSIPAPRVRELGNIGIHVPPLAIGATWIWLLATRLL
jgi:hypothetical protein